MSWSDALLLFRRPQPFTWQMAALFAVIPFYMVIAWQVVPGRLLHAPATPLDNAIPLVAGWSVVYVSLLLAVLLPAFVVQEEELLKRTVVAFLIAWLAALACFVAYPTVCPRPAQVEGAGFSRWMLRAIYASDTVYNCLPSLHVAQCFIAALACGVVNRAVGKVTLAWAALVALSTLFTKQHYVADVVGGCVLGLAAHSSAQRGYRRERLPAQLPLLAPHLAAGAFGAYGLIVAMLFGAYFA